jgi:hypothetical protein
LFALHTGAPFVPVTMARVHRLGCIAPRAGPERSLQGVTELGYSSHVFRHSSRPVVFFREPPHYLKKNATHWRSHETHKSSTHLACIGRA